MPRDVAFYAHALAVAVRATVIECHSCHVLLLCLRRTWVGAPWMDAVSDNPLDMSLVPSMKRKKGKKKEAAAGAEGASEREHTHVVPLCVS